jgi:hypothetical protein
MKRVFRCRKPDPAGSGCIGHTAILAVIATVIVAGCTAPDTRPQELQDNTPATGYTVAAGVTTVPPLRPTKATATTPSATATVTPDLSDPFEQGIVDGILIRGVDVIPAGDPLVVSGRTSLSAGMKLIVQVVPAIMKNGKIAGDYDNVEKRAETVVTEGTSNGNRFSVTIDTAGLSPANHLVSVTDADDEGSSGWREPSGVTGTLLFPIIAG